MRHLLTATLMLSLLGCAGAQSSGAAPASPAAVQTQGDTLDLTGFTVSSAEMFRDGGSIEVCGQTPTAANVLVRYDGKHGSETRGTVYLSPDGQAAHLRPMTRAEVDALLPALRQADNALPAGADPAVVQTLGDHLETYRAKAPQ